MGRRVITMGSLVAPIPQSGMFIAWSLRKVVDSYTGYAVRVRRSSDNAEADVAFDSTGRVSGSSLIDLGGDLTTWSGSSALYIRKLYDQMQNHDCGQSVAGNQPRLYLSGGYGGNAYIDYDGSNDYLGTANVLRPATDLTVVTFSSMDVNSSGHWLVNQRNNLAGGDQWQVVVAPPGSYSYLPVVSVFDTTRTNNLISDSVAAPISTYVQYALTLSGSLIKFYKNSNNIGTLTMSGTPALSSVPIYIGTSGWNLGALLWNGPIDEIIIYSRALNLSEINAINNR